jgi:hypothetical protein
LPLFPLPELPIIRDPQKAAEAVRHGSSQMNKDEQSYKMAANLGDSLLTIYCRDFAYASAPHVNVDLTTVRFPMDPRIQPL